MRIRYVARGVLAAAAACVVLAGQARAQNREKSWEISPEIGWTFYGDPNLGDGHTDKTFGTERRVETTTSTIKDSLNFGVRFAYHWKKKQAIEFGVIGTSTAGTILFHQQIYDTTLPPGSQLTTDRILSTDLSVDHLAVHANYVYNFFLQHRGKVVAYVAGGIGIINSSLFGQTSEPDLQPIIDALVGDENDFMYNYGTGIRFFGSEKVGFRMDARQVRYTSKSRDSQVQTEVGMALSIILGGA